MPYFNSRLQYELWRRFDSSSEAKRAANSLEHQTGQETRVKKVANRKQWAVYATTVRRISPLYNK